MYRPCVSSFLKMVCILTCDTICIPDKYTKFVSYIFIIEAAGGKGGPIKQKCILSHQIFRSMLKFTGDYVSCNFCEMGPCLSNVYLLDISIAIFDFMH